MPTPLRSTPPVFIWEVGGIRLEASSNMFLEQHKPGRFKPSRIKRAALSLQHQNGYTFDVCRVKHPGTKQLPIHISGASFEANLQIWLLGTTPFDTTPFICLRCLAQKSLSRASVYWYMNVLKPERYGFIEFEIRSVVNGQA